MKRKKIVLLSIWITSIIGIFYMFGVLWRQEVSEISSILVTVGLAGIAFASTIASALISRTGKDDSGLA